MSLIHLISEAAAAAAQVPGEEPLTIGSYVQQAIDILKKGGWAMWPLGATAFILYAKAGGMLYSFFLIKFRERQYFGGKEVVSKLGADSAASMSAYRAAQTYLDFHEVRLPDRANHDTVVTAFEELRVHELPPLDRDLKFIQVAIAAAPLWGLLGTVTGMLTTFDGLSKGGGGEKTMNVVAGGISEALITTETGLMIALPGYLLHYILTGKRNQFESFIEHLQNACGQRVLKIAERARRNRLKKVAA
jgi:biopolymer transport protein ExbB